MAAFTVAFAPQTVEQLENLETYIAAHGAPKTASAYTEAIVRHCQSLCTLPHRGVARDDIRPGLRITHYRGSTIIAFAVVGQMVYILGVFYGGQDYETILASSAS